MYIQHGAAGNSVVLSKRLEVRVISLHLTDSALNEVIASRVPYANGTTVNWGGNYNWINQLSNTTIWLLDIYVVYYIVINYMFRLLWPSSG